ncbi:hypothetical protein K6V72_09710 [Ralstonia insidiosa]|jgi:hypothetical protein|uniref:hypothetical protein n=1 Tax=Ralstonia insidiosa TaxID=190721 RepID=UPI0012440A1D|nr:hypothetical protein [Ralstonia insidiosa]KAB0471214.1 hypothetical protein F7R11_00990 [Ralstonia insidiosa]MBE0455856.1 hypothetical protein [Roseovarius sp.]MBY4909267.1 hypothetical protein [Ralstonia insidiosa]
MTTEAPQTDADSEDGTKDRGRLAKRDWLRLHAKSFSLRWTAVSGVLWLTAWNKAGYFLSGTSLIIAAIASSCAAIGFYIAHQVTNK